METVVAFPGQNVDGHDFASSPVSTSAALRTAVTLAQGRRLRSAAADADAGRIALGLEVDGATQDHANAERNGR
jgi:hypothetical protein